MARALGNGMTDRQHAFVREYLVDYNVTQAAIRAGYSPRSAREAGHRNMNNPLIKGEIRAAMERQSQGLQISKQWLVDRAVAIATKAEATTNYAAAIGAVKLLAQLSGQLVEKREIRQITSLADLTEEELRALAAEPHPGTAGADRTKH